MADHASILDGCNQADLALTGCTVAKPYDEAFIWVDGDDGEVSLRFRTCHGGDGTPEAVWNGRAREYVLSSNPDIEHLRDILAEGGAAAMLLDRVVAGLETMWNGSNMVGRMTEDAQEAGRELAQILADLPPSDLQTFDSENWLTSDLGAAYGLDVAEITPDATDQQIADAADNLRSVAKAEGHVLTGESLEQVLRRLIARLVEDRRVDVDEAT